MTLQRAYALRRMPMKRVLYCIAMSRILLRGFLDGEVKPKKPWIDGYEDHNGCHAGKFEKFACKKPVIKP